MIKLKDITLRRGPKLLLDGANLRLVTKQKVGLVGRNGCGKSSLLAMLRQQITPDQGECIIQPKIRIAYLAQEVPNTPISALAYTMAGDQELFELSNQLKTAEAAKDWAAATQLHDRLYALNGYDLAARAARILVGLGFTNPETEKAVNAFSGGWRMRLNLAQVLMSRAELLLLDEPTNYLDLDALVWLEEWLKNYAGTLLLISHDRDFLDQVVESIIYLGNTQLKSYPGNYSSFEKQRAAQLTQERSLYQKQQVQITHLNNYIHRFKATASKARQAQSRIKLLEKMELVSITRLDSPFSFNFPTTPAVGTPLLSLKGVTIAYGEHQVLRSVNFRLERYDRIGLLGMNGAGKSSLIKTLAGKMPSSAGELFFNRDLRIGYFAQYQIDQLDLQTSSLVMLQRCDPTISEKQARSFLGGFGFSNETIFQPITNFSGGEKARLVLALLIWQRPNLLLLDEPTNHLDLEMREALTYALQEYHGALVLVAHDRYLLKSVVDELYLVAEQKVEKFTGDLEDYQKWLLTTKKTPTSTTVPAQERLPQTTCAASSAHKRQNSGNAKQLKTLESELTKLQAEKNQLAEILATPELYAISAREQLETYLKQSANLEVRLKKLEEQWLQACA